MTSSDIDRPLDSGRYMWVRIQRWTAIVLSVGWCLSISHQESRGFKEWGNGIEIVHVQVHNEV